MAAATSEPSLDGDVEPTVSIIIPCHNSATTIHACVRSALEQDYSGNLEICIYDDSSTDDTVSIIRDIATAAKDIRNRRIRLLTSAEIGTDKPHGPAFARNRAVEISSGAYLCLLDSDDECMATRVSEQLTLARDGEHVLVGAGFLRDPADSTSAYTAWANSLSNDDLILEQWRECTVIQPTWFLSRKVYDAIGGWDEELPAFLRGEKGVVPHRHPEILTTAPFRLQQTELESHTFVSFPEDTIFFHRHLARGGTLARVASPQIVYRFSAGSQSWKIPRSLLLRLRVCLFEERVLFAKERVVVEGGRYEGTGVECVGRRDEGAAGDMGDACHEGASTTVTTGTTTPPASSPTTTATAWKQFTIWGAGRDGKAFYNALSVLGRQRVMVFCDIDPKKIGQVYPAPVRQKGKPALPIGAGSAAKRARLDEDGDFKAGDIPAAQTSPPEPHVEPVKIIEIAGVTPPVVCCVALTSKGSDLVRNVESLSDRLTPGRNFWYFV